MSNTDTVRIGFRTANGDESFIEYDNETFFRAVRTFIEDALKVRPASIQAQGEGVPAPLDGSESVEGAEEPEEPDTNGKPARRRRTKAEMEAARAAEKAALEAKINAVSAPAPMPIPSAPPPPPLVGAPAPGLVPPGFVTAPNPNGLPAFLDRTAVVTAGAVAAPPPPPPSPPVAPAPPICNLGRKVSDNLKSRGESPELLAWVISTGICKPGATWDEALSVFMFTSDDKVAPIAAALGVA